jgi:poly-gamma-glutamate synthesis protein (capsule biosynthesis protein)
MNASKVRPFIPLLLVLACLLKAPTSSANASPRQTSVHSPITIFVAGDVMLGRGVATHLRFHSTTLSRLKPQITGADIAFCNLESPLSVKPTRSKTSLYAEPSSIQYLQGAGFDIVSTANNHSFDAGENGVRLTHDTLNLAGIGFIGSRLDISGWSSWRTTVRGKSVAILAASAWGPYHSGKASIRPLANSGLVEQVRELADSTDVVLVSLHWGIEHTAHPTLGQRRTARAFIDAGADAIIGHHPHIVQTVENYRDRPIFYSLGNFLFDRMPREQSGMGALLSIDDTGKVTYKSYPVNPVPPSTSKNASLKMGGTVGKTEKKSLSAVPFVPPVATGEMVWARRVGRYLPNETRLQVMVWSKLNNGANLLRLHRREASGWNVVATGHHNSIYDLQRGDLDGDGYDDIVVGLNQRSKLDTTVRRRIHVYGADARHGFQAKWCGSFLSRPFRQFLLLPMKIQGKSYSALVAIEKNRLQDYRDFEWLAVYRWNGFGFRVLWDTPVRGTVSALRVATDRQGSYLKFKQKTRGVDRTLTLRPQLEIKSGDETKSGLIVFKANILISG